MPPLLISSSDIYSTYGGGQVYLKNIVREMVAQKIPFEIACPGEEKEVTYLDKKIHYFNPLAEAAEMMHFIQKLNPAVIHAHGFKAVFSKAGNALGIPVVITGHHGGILCPAGTLLNHKDEICQVKATHQSCLPCVLKNIRCGSLAYPILKQLSEKKAIGLSTFIKEKPFIPYMSPVFGASGSIANKLNDWETIVTFATKMITPSQAIADAMLRNGFPKDKLVVIPHGIPLPEKDYVKSKQFIRKPQFFYMGRINRVKGLHVLCEALKYVKADFDLHIYGNAATKAEKRYLGSLQRKYKSDKRVHWQGGVSSDQVFDTIAKMDVMIHPTISMEIFGLNIAETLALGIPVIATRCGGAEMQIEDGVNGVLVKPNDAKELAKTIQAVLNNEYQLKVNTETVIDVHTHVLELNKMYEALSH
jgi:glycosyltransferase involved in cell wall biosynthesis